MEKWMIRGGKPLEGTVQISGSFKSALAVLSASLLASTPSVLNSVPRVRQIDRYLQFLKDLNIGVEVNGDQGQIWIHPQMMKCSPVVVDSFLEGLIFLPGALLGRFGECTFHGYQAEKIFRSLEPALKGFEAMGAKMYQAGRSWTLSVSHLRGVTHYLDQSHMECTINLMLAASRTEEKTVIHHAAKDPEVIDVAMFLNGIGVDVKGAGTDSIRIQGRKELKGSEHALIPDRIEAGILLIAAAGTGGWVELQGVIPKHVEAVLLKLKEMGIHVETTAESILIARSKPLSSVDVKGYLYPGIPIDLQQPFSSLLTQAQGTSLVIDPVFSSSFQPVEELKKMGARIKTDGRTTVIEGPTPLSGTRVAANDAISGVSLVLAGLMASGVTEVEQAGSVDESMEAFDEKLRRPGADLWRESGRC